MGSNGNNSAVAANVVGRRPGNALRNSATPKPLMQDSPMAAESLLHGELEAFLDALPDLYIRVHSDGTVVACRTSDGRNLSAVRSQGAGTTLFDLLPTPSAMQAADAIQQVLKTHRPSRIEYTLPGSYGERTFEARLVRFGESDLLAIIREIPDRGQVEMAQGELIEQSQSAAGKLTGLDVLLPICSKCKRIRDDQGDWERLEKYLLERLGLQVTHSFCPQCAHALYPEVFPTC